MRKLTFEQYMKEWLETLESPECPYQQTMGKLGSFNYGGFCCLGVINELFNFGCSEEDGVLENDKAALLHLNVRITTDERTVLFPHRIGELGMFRQDCLAFLNDDGVENTFTISSIPPHKRTGLTFPQIAQVVRYLGWDKE